MSSPFPFRISYVLDYVCQSGSLPSSDLKIVTPVAALPVAWHAKVSARLVGLVSVHCDQVKLQA